MVKFIGPAPRQKQVLDVIAYYVGAINRAPTMREIGKAVGLRSTNAVEDNLRALERKHYIVREEQMACGIRLTKKARDEFGYVVEYQWAD